MGDDRLAMNFLVFPPLLFWSQASAPATRFSVFCFYDIYRTSGQMDVILHSFLISTYFSPSSPTTASPHHDATLLYRAVPPRPTLTPMHVA